jgi:hypothetical protein
MVNISKFKIFHELPSYCHNNTNNARQQDNSTILFSNTEHQHTDLHKKAMINGFVIITQIFITAVNVPNFAVL